MNGALDSGASETAARVIELATARGLTIAVAESLTGGLLTAALVDVPGASAVLRGGIVAYATPLKHSLLGVDAARLAAHGAVDAVVAAQMARGARIAATIDGTPASIGIATTGVAGPDPQDGQPVGTVHLGYSHADPESTGSVEERFEGGRAEIRRAAVEAALRLLLELIEDPARPR